VKAYIALLRGGFLAGIIYRFGFLFSLTGNVVYMSVAFYLWRSIYSANTEIHGLSFHETFIYVALGSSVFILLKTYVDWNTAYEIREGLIAVYLVKPFDYQLYTLFTSFGFNIMNIIVITIPTIILITLVFQIPLVLGWGLLLFPVSFLLAYLINFCFDYFIGVMSFYTESIWGISITKDVLISVLSGALIPLPFYPESIQRILLLLPFQAIYYTPLMMVTKPDLGWQTLGTMLGVQLFWVCTLFIATRLFFQQAVKVLRVSGG
jgi:ABC-2 type transport system permease protein